MGEIQEEAGGDREGDAMIMDRNFHEVGCRKCGKGGHWSIYHDGNGHFRAMHPCGHISDFVVVKEKDTQPKPIDMRLFA
jgi:hypothetical protein